jgi:hypothetical protein
MHDTFAASATAYAKGKARLFAVEHDMFLLALGQFIRSHLLFFQLVTHGEDFSGQPLGSFPVLPSALRCMDHKVYYTKRSMKIGSVRFGASQCGVYVMPASQRAVVTLEALDEPGLRHEDRIVKSDRFAERIGFPTREQGQTVDQVIASPVDDFLNED